MSLTEVVNYFDGYVTRFGLPVHCGVEVYSVEKTPEGYLVRTWEGNYDAKNVVIATGLYQSPKIPEFSEAIPAGILQIHSMKYRGVTAYEGLYFLGMPWLHKRKSGILFGVGDDAAYLAERIAARETTAEEIQA
jgi:hypothetical protein